MSRGGIRRFDLDGCCIHLETGCGGVVFFFRWRAGDIFLLYSFFHFSLTTFDWNCTTEKMTI